MSATSERPLVYLLVPCFNEAALLGRSLAELPQGLPDLRLKVLVVDDGSTDKSATIAAAGGAEVLRLEHVGLAQAYRAGLQEALARGADLIVSLDADGQYDPAALPWVLEHLRAGSDVVLVERGDSFYQRLSRGRRLAHGAGRWGTRLLTGLPVTDPVTGYRGYSRRAASLLMIRSSYTYTLETLAQARPLGLTFSTLTAAPREVTRPSRLFKHPFDYVKRQGGTLLWSTWTYRVRPHLRLEARGRDTDSRSAEVPANVSVPL